MYEKLLRLIIENGAQLIYVTNRAMAATIEGLKGDYAPFHHELCLNEKIAYEFALAGSYAAKRTACIFTAEGLYDALDAVMSSAYTGVAGSFVVVCTKETDEEVTPVGPFAKLPVILTGGDGELPKALSYAYGLSERHKIPVLLQVDMTDAARALSGGTDGAPVPRPPRAPADFSRDPSRWAATPRFRYLLHLELNEKVERIRAEFERYGGNREIAGGRTGIIRSGYRETLLYDEDSTVLHIATPFQLPRGLVTAFVAKMDQVFLVEGEHPVIALQMDAPESVLVEPYMRPPERLRHGETIHGLTVVRDWLGPGSSLNIAHGMMKTDPSAKVLAISFEDYFFHSGMASLVNTLYNDSAYILLILTRDREEEMRQVMEGMGFRNCHRIDEPSAIARFADRKDFTVLFYRGLL